MAIVCRHLKVFLLMRIGPKSEIERCLHDSKITFGCPANWIDYQYKHSNSAIGDIFECIFAHLPKTDSRVWNQVDSYGKPMRDNLLLFQNKNDDSFLLRYIPAILTPTLCLYAIKREDLPLNIEKVVSDMGYSTDDSAVLFITNIERFFDELREQMPIAVRGNKNLTSKRFYSPFEPDHPIDANYVNYDKYTAGSRFYERPKNLEELFWKLPDYRWQSEFRIVISKINFVQGYNPNEEYDPKKNYLDVSLPNLHEYAKIYYLKK